MFSQSSDPPTGHIYGSVPKSLKLRLHVCMESAIKEIKIVLIRRQQVEDKRHPCYVAEREIADEFP